MFGGLWKRDEAVDRFLRNFEILSLVRTFSILIPGMMRSRSRRGHEGNSLREKEVDW